MFCMDATFDSPRSFVHVPRHRLVASDLATQAHANVRARSLAFGLAAVATPLAVAGGLFAAGQGRRTALLAGGAAAFAFGLVRWQLQRWFTDEPAYTVESHERGLEIRSYHPRVEAHTRFATVDFDDAREHGFRRLASYIFGGNEGHQKLAMTAPVTIAARGQAHTVAFVMPPDHASGALPEPDDSRVQLVEVPARRVAVLRYRGRYTEASFVRHAAKLRERCASAGLTTRGEPMFAGFDPPSTLPLLRRTEIWIELA